MKSIVAFLGLALASAPASTLDLDKRQAGCTPFTNAATGAASCCDETVNTLFFIDRILDLGICCPLGNLLDGLVCAPAPPRPSAPVCSGDPVCPSTSGQDLGIRYGSCYVLQALTNNYLGHQSDGRYVVLGENPGVVFRVCATRDDACTANEGALVATNGTWFMQDQFGDPTGTGFGWIGGSGDLSVQDAAADALTMGGSSLCYGGMCSICITFPPGGASAPCPLPPGQSHLGVANNPNTCQAFIWQEVGCRSEM